MQLILTLFQIQRVLTNPCDTYCGKDDAAYNKTTSDANNTITQTSNQPSQYDGSLDTWLNLTQDQYFPKS